MKKLLITSILILFPFLVSAKTFDSNLYFGITNNSDVQMLQEFLTDQGVYSGPITGNFFSLTLAGVKNYQIQNNITPAAGFFGPITRAKANEILSVQIQNSDTQAITETGATAPPVTQNSQTDNSQSLMQILQAQILALQQQLIQMQQQNQTIQNQQTQIQSQQTQIQQNQITAIQQQVTTPTPTPTPTTQNQNQNQISIPEPLKPTFPVNELGIFINNITTYGQNDSLNSLLNNSSQSLIRISTAPISSELFGDTSFYINENLIATKHNKLSSTSFNPSGLVPDSIYTYKAIFKIDGREDTIRTGQFRTPKSEPGKTYQVQSGNSNGTYYCSDITNGWQIPIIIWEKTNMDLITNLTDVCP